MTLTATDVEQNTMRRSLEQFNAGEYVTDDLYRHFLKEHGKGHHNGMTLNLCPACQFPV
jgi:hypothetical protein